MRFSRLLTVFAAVCVIAACSGGSAAPAAQSSAPASSSSKAGKANKNKSDSGSVDQGDDTSASGKDCPNPPSESGLNATATALSDTVQAVVFPLPNHTGNPWSQWGIGTFGNGKFFSAIGDHCAQNGDSYIYEYDPSTSKLQLLTDALTVIGHQPGDWGYGKIHARMINGADGAIYVTTYWGSSTGVQFTSGYDGDVLLRIDPSTGQVTSLGVPISKHGVPSLASSPDGKTLYGEAIDPVSGERDGLFFAYDIAQRKVVFQMDKPSGVKGYRNILVDSTGKAWFSIGANQVAIYDPATNTATTSDIKLPGVYLRAATRPAPDGTVYGITAQPDVLFKITTDGQLHTMGPVRGYTASVAMSPDGSKLYYVPDAHGTSFEQGAPVIEVDTATGTEREVVRLDDLTEAKLQLKLGGSYDVVLDPSGNSLYIGLNAGDPAAKEGFGSVVLAIVKLH